MKQRINFIYTIILVALLAACGIASPVPTIVPMATSTPSSVPASSTPTIPPATLTPTPTSPIPLSTAPDVLRMAYVIDGNLYFQDSSEPPLQLTHGGEERHILFFSEDGEKIFFLRGMRGHSIYSINIDGSQEQALVTNSLLRTFDVIYDESTMPCNPVLVPHTPLLLFRTCSYPDEYTIVQEDDLFIVDTDTHQVKKIFSRGQGGSYYVSPDGNMIAVGKSNYIDIVDIDGRMIRQKVATYTLSEPIPLGSLVYWLSDSSELILALPINTFYDTAPPPLYEIWRYSLDTGERVQINLDPPVMGHEATWVSPDGNWITYTNSDEGFFLGNLHDNHTQELPGITDEWSPDSIHFVYDVFKTGRTGLYLGSVDAPPVFIGDGEFVVWLDASRYVYFTSANNAPTYVMGEVGKVPVPILAGNTWDLRSYGNIIFHYHPLSE